VWQDEVVPGSVVVAYETLVGWAGATNINITKLPNKPASIRVCLKTLCDAQTPLCVHSSLWKGWRSRGTSITPTSFALMQKGLCNMGNVKTQSKIFCKRTLLEDAQPEQPRRNHKRNHRTCLHSGLPVNGKLTDGWSCLVVIPQASELVMYGFHM
jgi:hypothetical protein